jgi:ribonuclease P protein component
VPAKAIRKASSRNLVKRRMREAYRRNKAPLYTHLTGQNKQMAIMLIYIDRNILPYDTIEEKIKCILSRLIGTDKGSQPVS